MLILDGKEALHTVTSPQGRPVARNDEPSRARRVETDRAIELLDGAFARGFNEPMTLHVSGLHRTLADVPAYRARLELHGLR